MSLKLITILSTLTVLPFASCAHRNPANFTKTEDTKISKTKLTFNTPVVLAASKIELTRIISDSRCPEDAQCMWAGQFIAEFKITKNGTSKLFQMGLSGDHPIRIVTENGKLTPQNGPTELDGLELSVAEVSPQNKSQKILSIDDYELNIEFK